MISTVVEKVMVVVIGFAMAERCIRCDEELMHKFFMCLGCLVTCSDALGKRG
jgi:hypothetical protein